MTLPFFEYEPAHAKKGSASRINNERGVALLMTVVIIAIASILVMDLTFRARYDHRHARAFSEGLQGDYILKSGVSIGRLLLEIPKLPGSNGDNLGEPWAVAAAFPNVIPTEIAADTRLSIVDEDGKIDLNALVSASGSSTPPPGSSPPPGAGGSTSYWHDVVTALFQRMGFVRESFDATENRTLGNTGLDAATQVAVIHDWIDRDRDSYAGAGQGDGFEAQAPKQWFFNRPLKSMSELLLIPGLTLERLARISPFVKTGNGGFPRVNINTAPSEVLLALGVPESSVSEILAAQSKGLDDQTLNAVTAGIPQLRSATKLNSNNFSIYVRAEMPNVTRWVKTYVTAQGGAQQRKTQIVKQEFY